MTGAVKIKGEENAILVSLDSVRQDKLFQCVESMPALKELMKKSSVFTNTVTCSNATCPSHAAILTGKYPWECGVRENGVKLKEQFTFPKLFQQAGVYCAGFVSVEHLSSYFNFNQGFNEFHNNNDWDWLYHKISEHRIRIGRFKSTSFLTLARKLGLLPSTHSRPWRNTFKQVSSFLENQKNRFFAFMHFFDVHYPYSDSYEKEIIRLNKLFELLIQKLKETGLWKKTVLVVTSDHGENLGEHGKVSAPHGYELYEEEIRIPLLIKAKTLRKAKHDFMVKSIDVLPTISSLLGITGHGMENNSITSKNYCNDIAFFESYPLYSDKKGLKTSSGLKYIEGKNKRELFNLIEDPEEKNNLAESFPEKTQKFSRLLHKEFSEKRFVESQKTEYTVHQLKGLGYL